jgi:hypothetical protein
LLYTAQNFDYLADERRDFDYDSLGYMGMDLKYWIELRQREWKEKRLSKWAASRTCFLVGA